MAETKAEAKGSLSSIARQTEYGRILLAEDDETIRNYIYKFLRYIGFEVGLAENGLDALAVFLDRSFDLVLTDFQMPVMDGLSLAGQIKERSPSTPVILLTGSDMATVQKKVKRGLVDSVIFKPFRLEDLQRTVQGALASREQESGGQGMGGRLGASAKSWKSLDAF